MSKQKRENNSIKIINKTPHPITILDEEYQPQKKFEACSKEDLIRLEEITVPAGEVNGIPITETVYGEPEGLPESAEGTYYIVFQLVKNALPKRDDLLVPAQVVRDEEDNIIGCHSLGR